MQFVHKPVLYKECIDGLKINPSGIYVDGTVGGAGHSSGILEKLNKDGILICIDQDKEALEAAKEKIANLNTNDNKIFFENANFSQVKEVCKELGFEKVDGILLDIGVSSYQLDNPARGFSYNYDAPLDMRMDLDANLTAHEIINKWSKVDIKKIIKDFGEENWADRIAEFIVKARVEGTIETTFQLVDLIKAAIPAKARRDGPHPAKRTFQAIRIAVNDELGVLQKVASEGVELLDKGGRFCVITFHSLEDRIVKTKFSEMANPCNCPRSLPVCICGKLSSIKIITKKPIIPSEEEIEENPRSRSSKLRIVEKF